MAFLGTFARSWSKASRPQPQPHDDHDADADQLEHSFASNMSLNSPPHSPALTANRLLAPASGYSAHHSPMDISPCPSKNHLAVPRTFGRDLANSPETSDGSRSANKGRQRSALPLEWMGGTPDLMRPKASTASTLVELPDFDEHKDSDAMDIDSPEPRAPKVVPAPLAPPPVSNDLAALFFDTMSPPAPQPPTKKRRSMSPEGVRDASSSPAASSPIARKFERFATTGQQVNLFKKPTIPVANLNGGSTNGHKRARRPVLSQLIPPTAPGEGVQSSYPILMSAAPASKPAERPKPAQPPVRRAFSALVEPKNAPMLFGHDLSSDDASTELDSSPAGAYARRQETRLVRKADGTADFRPVHGAGALDQLDREQVKGNVGMPEFGDVEKLGKILPCERVKDDGLVRINHGTLCDLLDGHYDDKIDSFMIIDCRFDYEFAGGHIPGALNVNGPEMLEKLLLASAARPSACASGDSAPKRVLIFHCELSQERAPKLAKHLRSRDRHFNQEVYPKLYYPEVYILQGGYKSWYSNCPDRCEPRGYVIMDDIKHKAACEDGMDQFRKFNRARSYTYGDRPNVPGLPPARQPQRSSAPVGSLAPPVFGASAGLQRPRRGTMGSTLGTLTEAGDGSHSGDEATVEDSPCPPVTKSIGLRNSKGRTLERAMTSRAY